MAPSDPLDIWRPLEGESIVMPGEADPFMPGVVPAAFPDDDPSAPERGDVPDGADPPEGEAEPVPRRVDEFGRERGSPVLPEYCPRTNQTPAARSTITTIPDTMGPTLSVQEAARDDREDSEGGGKSPACGAEGRRGARCGSEASEERENGSKVALRSDGSS